VPPLRDAILAATDALGDAGVPRPEKDAEALALHVLDLHDTTELHAVDELEEIDAATLAALVARRAAREPLPHLTGRVHFRGIELEVGPGAFVPQPETEPVVAWAVDEVRASGRPAPLLADLCTGAGTIAFSLANELPTATVHAVERDPTALGWAERNAARRVAAGDPRVHLHLADVDGCLPELDGQLDLVASNPPYVATHEHAIPDPEVLDHDPAIALWAGRDGLDVVRLVERAARRLLRPGGAVVIEHSDRQGRTAPEVLRAAGGWSEVAGHRDQQGRDRFVTARWAGG
jgi:release factor glutamine methyltransferase